MLFEVNGCSKTGGQPVFYSWRNASCRAKEGAEVGSPDKRAREHGHELAAAGLEPGQWVLVEAYDDDVDELWLGKTVDFGGFGSGGCCKKHTGPQGNKYRTRFNMGDCMVTVQWYERVGEDGERREFVTGELGINVVNST